MKVIIYDGECMFCNKTMMLIFEHLRLNVKEAIFFTSLSSEWSKNNIYNLNNDLIKLKSEILFYENGQIYKASKAIFKIAKYLNNPYRFISFFSIVPNRLSDFFYYIIAERRYFISNKLNCSLPSKEFSQKILN